MVFFLLFLSSTLLFSLFLLHFSLLFFLLLPNSSGFNLSSSQLLSSSSSPSYFLSLPSLLISFRYHFFPSLLLLLSHFSPSLLFSLSLRLHISTLKFFSLAFLFFLFSCSSSFLPYLCHLFSISSPLFHFFFFDHYVSLFFCFTLFCLSSFVCRYTYAIIIIYCSLSFWVASSYLYRFQPFFLLILLTALHRCLYTGVNLSLVFILTQLNVETMRVWICTWNQSRNNNNTL